MHRFDSIIPIILAAGDSTRMRYPKALLPIGNDTFLRHILRIAGDVGLGNPVVVLGRSAPLIEPTIQDYRAQIQINEDPDRGQLSSIQIGISSLESAVRACMIWPVDQPAIPVDLVRRLADRFLVSKCLMAFPEYGGKRGHPAIFGRSVFQEFLDAPLAEGPKQIILRHLQDIVQLPTGHSTVVQDIDTPLDYEALTGESVESALARFDSAKP